MIEISIVVPTYQRVDIVRRSLPTWLAQDLGPGRLEIVVVVDGSTDATESVLAGHAGDSRLRVLTQPNRGLAAARNRGAREARGRVILFLDDDAHASEGLARRHLERHADGGSRVVLGAFPLLPAARRSFLAAGVGRWSDQLAERLARSGTRPHFTDVSFANTSMPRVLWESSEGFRESFREFGNEDYELALRLQRAGVEFVFAPEALAWQDYRKDFPTWCREWRSVGRADVRLLGLHPEAAPDLTFSRMESFHPFRRALLRAGLRGSRLSRAVVVPVRFILTVADRLGLRGALWDRLKWLPADAEYARGLQEAQAEKGDIPLFPEKGTGLPAKRHDSRGS